MGLAADRTAVWRGPGGRENVLVERFTAVDEWADLVEEAKADLTEELFASGYAEEVLDRWVDVLTEQAAISSTPHLQQEPTRSARSSRERPGGDGGR